MKETKVVHVPILCVVDLKEAQVSITGFNFERDRGVLWQYVSPTSK